MQDCSQAPNPKPQNVILDSIPVTSKPKSEISNRKPQSLPLEPPNLKPLIPTLVTTLMDILKASLMASLMAYAGLHPHLFGGVGRPEPDRHDCGTLTHPHATRVTHGGAQGGGRRRG